MCIDAEFLSLVAGYHGSADYVLVLCDPTTGLKYFLDETQGGTTIPTNRLMGEFDDWQWSLLSLTDHHLISRVTGSENAAAIRAELHRRLGAR